MEWKPISDAQPDGTVADLRFRDNLGTYELSQCFLHDDGEWYKIDHPPVLIVKKPIAWRVANW